MGKKDKAAKQAKKELRDQKHAEACAQDKLLKQQAEYKDPNEINKMISTICINIERKEYVFAKKFYNQMLNKYPDQKPQIQAQILCQIDTSYTQSDIDNIFSLFKINLANITFRGHTVKGKVLLFNATPKVIDIIHDNWLQDQEKAKDLFEYFITQNLPLQETQARNHGLMCAIISYHGDPTFIKMLLESGHLDVNTLITPKNDDRCNVAKTPFSMALGTLNTSLLKVLLEHGADPYLAAEETRQHMPIHKNAYKFRVATNLGIQNLTDDEQQEYLLLVDKIINDFFLRKLEEDSAAEIIKTAQEESPEEELTPPI